jgi:hypothetical protein
MGVEWQQQQQQRRRRRRSWLLVVRTCFGGSRGLDGLGDFEMDANVERMEGGYLVEVKLTGD